MRRNGIIVSSEPGGRFVEGFIGSGITTAYPGKAMQLQPATALVGGRETWELYNADADGGRPKGPIIILLENSLFGKDVTVAYTAGDRAYGYIPKAGDELNLLFGESILAGTTTVAAGETLIIGDGTGLFIPTTGSPETEVAQTKEAITDNDADSLVWCQWTGY